MPVKKNTFENKMNRLDEIAKTLDNDEVGLEEAIRLFEEGIDLSKECLDKLKEAELKITVLKKNLSGDNQNVEDTENTEI